MVIIFIIVSLYPDVIPSGHPNIELLVEFFAALYMKHTKLCTSWFVLCHVL